MLPNFIDLENVLSEILLRKRKKRKINPHNGLLNYIALIAALWFVLSIAAGQLPNFRATSVIKYAGQILG